MKLKILFNIRVAADILLRFKKAKLKGKKYKFASIIENRENSSKNRSENLICH